jgi:hypothetical protein
VRDPRRALAWQVDDVHDAAALAHWAEVIADPVISHAMRDRLEHAVLTIDITGESYRGVKARKLASKKAGA